MSHLFAGSIPELVEDPHGVYSGSLRHYIKLIFQAQNVHNGYHGLRHMLHVPWVVYEACRYYQSRGVLSKQQARILLIAAILHDYNHPGKGGDDALNIEIALQALDAYLLHPDKKYRTEIVGIIEATHFPHGDFGGLPTLEQQILRDADMSQTFSPAWIGDIAAGLGGELGRTPVHMLKESLTFLKSLKFYTDFGNEVFGQKAIDMKIKEVRSLLEVLR